MNETIKCPKHGLPIVNDDGCPKCLWKPEQQEQAALPAPTTDPRCAFTHNDQRCPMPGTFAEVKGDIWRCRHHWREQNRFHGEEQDKFFAYVSNEDNRRKLLRKWYPDQQAKMLRDAIDRQPGPEPGESNSDYRKRLLRRSGIGMARVFP